MKSVEPHALPASGTSVIVAGHCWFCAQIPPSFAGMICHCVPVQYAVVSHVDSAAAPYSQEKLPLHEEAALGADVGQENAHGDASTFETSSLVASNEKLVSGFASVAAASSSGATGTFEQAMTASKEHHRSILVR